MLGPSVRPAIISPLFQEDSGLLLVAFLLGVAIARRR
jgi:hypothetical protein